jgi:DNA repair exonuclease SbcCD ATPase subunit
MAMTVQDFHDLVRLLEAHPQWRAELRHLLLTDELLALPDIVRELAAAQRRTEERIEELAAAQQRTEVRVEELAAAQRRTEERLETVALRVEELAAAQRRTEERIEELAAAQRRTEERIEELAAAQRRTEERIEELAAAQRRTEERVGELATAEQHAEDRIEELAIATKQLVALTAKLTDDVGMLKGYMLERTYRERAPSYFAGLLRGVHALSAEEVARFVEQAVARAELSDEDRHEVMQTDLVIRGIRRDDGTEAYLAVEVSAGIGRHDVSRAQQRARILERLLAKPVLPVVAGEWITPEAEEQAIATHVWRVLDGRSQAPGGDGAGE